MFLAIFKPREIHKFTQANGIFQVVVCRYNTLSQSEEGSLKQWWFKSLLFISVICRNFDLHQTARLHYSTLAVNQQAMADRECVCMCVYIRVNRWTNFPFSSSRQATLWYVNTQQWLRSGWLTGVNINPLLNPKSLKVITPPIGQWVQIRAESVSLGFIPPDVLPLLPDSLLQRQPALISCLAGVSCSTRPSLRT